MKETIGKVKKLVKENKDAILVGALGGVSCAFGMAYGYYVMGDFKAKAALGRGVVDGINIVKANGLEAAEEFVAGLYKIKT